MKKLNDLDQGRMLDVVEHRTSEAAKQLLDSQNKKQRRQVKTVSVDIWKSYDNAVEELLPYAHCINDRFYISKYLSQAVYAVRCKESLILDKAGNQEKYPIIVFRKNKAPSAYSVLLLNITQLINLIIRWWMRIRLQRSWARSASLNTMARVIDMVT